MSVEGSALQVIKAAGITSAQLISLAQPFGGRLPTTEQELDTMCSQMRRTYHILEGHPGNIGSLLHGPPRQAHRGAYLSEVMERSESEDIQHFLTDSRSNQHEFDGWEWVGAAEEAYNE